MNTQSRESSARHSAGRIADHLPTIFAALETEIDAYVDDVRTIDRAGLPPTSAAALSRSHVDAIHNAIALQRQVGALIALNRRAERRLSVQAADRASATTH